MEAPTLDTPFRCHNSYLVIILYVSLGDHLISQEQMVMTGSPLAMGLLDSSPLPLCKYQGSANVLRVAINSLLRL